MPKSILQARQNSNTRQQRSLLTLNLIVLFLGLMSSVYPVLASDPTRIVSFFSKPSPIIGRSVVALLQPSIVAASNSPTTSIEHATPQQLASLCLEFQFDVAEWAVLSHDRVLMMAYFLEKAGSVVDDPRGTRWCTGDRVQVSEHGIEAIEGTQLLLPPSVVAIIHAQMELQESIDQALVDAVLPENQPQQASVEPSRPNLFSKQPTKQSKRKKQATSKITSLEKPVVTPAKKQPVGELDILRNLPPGYCSTPHPQEKEVRLLSGS